MFQPTYGKYLKDVVEPAQYKHIESALRQYAFYAKIESDFDRMRRERYMARKPKNPNEPIRLAVFGGHGATNFEYTTACTYAIHTAHKSGDGGVYSPRNVWQGSLEYDRFGEAYSATLD